MYGKPVNKFNVLLLRYQELVDKQSLENKIKDADEKIPNTSGLVKKTDYNRRTTEIEKKIPSVTGLATTKC